MGNMLLLQIWCVVIYAPWFTSGSQDLKQIRQPALNEKVTITSWQRSRKYCCQEKNTQVQIPGRCTEVYYLYITLRLPPYIATVLTYNIVQEQTTIMRINMHQKDSRYDPSLSLGNTNWSLFSMLLFVSSDRWPWQTGPPLTGLARTPTPL